MLNLWHSPFFFGRHTDKVPMFGQRQHVALIISNSPQITEYVCAGNVKDENKLEMQDVEWILGAHDFFIRGICQQLSNNAINKWLRNLTQIIKTFVKAWVQIPVYSRVYFEQINEDHFLFILFLIFLKSVRGFNVYYATGSFIWAILHSN